MSEIPTQETEQGDCHELEAKLRQANLLGKKTKQQQQTTVYIKCAVAREMAHPTECLL